MNDALLLRNLAAYSAQIAIVIVIGGAVMALLGKAPPRARYTFAQLLLIFCLCLPFAQTRQAASGSLDVQVSTDVVGSASAEAVHRVERSALPRLVPTLLVAGIALRLIWVAVGLCRLRRLRHQGEVAALTGEDEALRDILKTRAEIRYGANIHRPFTFGVVSPVVLLPVELRRCPSDVQRAVLCHELLHVQRKDWVWLLAEEMVRAALWFHPAVWWWISQIQAAREEVVDRLTVSLTGNRRAYMEALLTFSHQTSRAPAAAFGRPRLFRRIGLISQEIVMSRTHLAFAFAVVAVATIAGTWYAVAAFPLQQSTSGPREQQARPITPENPIPRRMDSVRPVYPAALAGSGLQAFATAQIVLDESGRVAEARRAYIGVSRASDYSQPQPSPVDGDAANLFWQSVDDAVHRWYYEAPWMAPIAFSVSFRFAPDSDGLELNATPAPFSPPPLWHAGAAAVGDDIAPPQKIKDVRPAYPVEAQNARVQGIVILEVRIEPDGRVSNTRVMRSIPELDRAAVDAVSQWEFSPTLDAGRRPIPVIMTVTVQFTLS